MSDEYKAKACFTTEEFVYKKAKKTRMANMMKLSFRIDDILRDEDEPQKIKDQKCKLVF